MCAVCLCCAVLGVVVPRWGLTAGGLLYLFYWALIFFFLEFTVNNEGAQPQKVWIDHR